MASRDNCQDRRTGARLNSALKYVCLSLTFSLVLTSNSPAVFALDTISSRQSESSSTNAIALAEKVIEKLGGLDKIKKFNSQAYRATGSVEQISSLSGSSNTLPCQIVAQGRKQWISVAFMGQDVVTGYDGKTCWTKQGANAMPTDPITAKRVEEDLDHGLLLVEKLLDKGRKLSLAKPETINGIQCEALNVVADDGKTTTFYVDPDSGLILRSEFQGADIEQGVDCLKAYEYFDYRPLNGTLQPYKAVEYSDKKKVSVVDIAKMESPANIPDNLFKMPSEAKIARLKSGPVRLPFQFVGNEILVTANINGLAKHFIVDTGATQSIVDSNCIRELMPGKKSDEIEITTGSGAMKMGFAQLKTFQIGDIVLDDITVAVADLSKFAQFLPTKPHGLIGANILKRFLITIDYERSELILADPDRVVVPKDAVVVETKPSLGVSGLAVEGVIDGQLKLSFLVDSGAAFNHVAEPLIKGLHNDPLLPVGIIKGLDGTPVQTGAIRFKSLELGNLKIDEPVFSVAPSKGEGDLPQGIISGGALAIIGNPLLSRFRVTIDYRNQRIIFEDPLRKDRELDLRSKQILTDYYRGEDSHAAAQRFAKLSQDAMTRGNTALAALSMANEALFRSRVERDGKSTKSIQEQFATAFDIAKRTDKKPPMAQVLSLWAQYFLENGDSHSSNRARPLISKALFTCPTEPAAYAVAGLMTSMSTRASANDSEDWQGKGVSSSETLLNQALMLDPSNWLALWTRYKIAEQSGRRDEQSQIAKNLKRYYPDALKVQKLKD